MVVIVPVPKRHQKTGVRDRLHLREKPLRVERPAGPATAPAKRRKRRLAEFRAFSSSSRMMRPFDTPVLRAAWFSHSARSPGSLTVTVLLICSKCNTNLPPMSGPGPRSRAHRGLLARQGARAGRGNSNSCGIAQQRSIFGSARKARCWLSTSVLKYNDVL